MGKCTTLYLDTNGQKHPAYYSVEKTSGHKAALQNYLSEMAPILSTSFQKITVDNLIVESKSFKRRKSVTKGRGGPSASKKLVSQFNERDVAKESVLYSRAVELIELDPFWTMELIRKESLAEKDRLINKFKDEARNHYLSTPELKVEYNADIDATLERWNKDKQEKSDYHDIIDVFIQEHTKQVKKAAEAKERGEKYTGLTDLFKDFTSVRHSLSPLEVKVIGEINKFLKETLINDPDARVVPEMALDVPGWDNNSRIDLFVYYPKTNRTIIYDFKFYSEKSFEEYANNYRGQLSEPAQNLKNNNRDLNALQMSEYTRMLEEHGITGVEAYIIPFVLEEDKEASTIGSVKYADVKKADNIPTSYYKTEIEAIMRKKGIDVNIQSNDRYVEGKISTVASFYDGITTKSSIRSSVVAEDKASIDSINVTIDKDGVHKFFDEIHGKTAVVKGETKKKRDEFLKSYLRIKKEYDIHLEDEIINYVQNGMENWNASSKIKGAKKSVNIRELALKHGTRDLEDEAYGSRQDILDALKATANSRLQGDDPRMEAALRQLFQGLSPEYYKFERATNDSRFRKEGENKTSQIVIKVTHKSTGAITLIGISPNSYGSMKFDHGNNKTYSTVLGNFITNKDAGRRLVDRKDKQFNMELVALAAMMKEMKYDDPSLKFMPPKVGVLRGGRIPSRSMNLAELDHILEVASQVIPKEQITDTYKDILRTKIVPSNNLTDHYMLEALDILENSNFITSHLLTQEPALTVVEQLSNIRVSSGANYTLLKRSLTELKRSMDKVFSTRELDGHPADYDWYVKVANLILVLEGMDPMVNIGSNELKSPLTLKMTTMANIDHQYFTAISKIYKAAQLQVFDEFSDRKVRHDKLIKEYMVSEGVTADFSSEKVKRDMFMKLFKVISPDPNVGEIRNKLMVLKDEADLHSAQAKALVKHMIDTQNDMIKMYLGDEKYDDFIKSDRYIPGAMPVQETVQDTRYDENPTPASLAKKWKEGLMGRKRNEREEQDSKFSYDIYNPFMDQVLSPDSRLSRAGYDPGGEMVQEVPLQLDYSLDVLFESMVLNTLTQRHYEQALVVKSAADIALITQEKSGNVRTAKLQEMLDGFTNLIIFETIDNAFEDDSDHLLIRSSSALSKVALALSPSYMIMETLTNSFNLIGEMSTQYFTKLFVKDSNMHFTAKDMVKAVNLVVAGDREKTHKLAARYGMLVRDPSKLASARFRESQSSIFNSKSFYWLNAIPIEISQTIVLVAKMLHDGSYEAHTVTSDGELVYNEKKDERFFQQPGENISDKKVKERTAKHKFYLEEIAKEGGLNEDGTLRKAYSQTDVTTMHTLTTERFASLSADQKVLVETIPLGIAFMRFKNWMIAKKEVWWKEYNPNSTLKNNLEWVVDPNLDEGGYFTYVGEPSEGLFQSLVAVGSGLWFKNSQESVPEALKIVRKKNAVRAVNDLMLAAFIGMLVRMMFANDEKLVKQRDGTYVSKEIPNDKFSKALYRSVGNATADLTFFIPAYNMFFDSGVSVIPVVGAFSRLVKSTYGIVMGVGTLDEDKILDSFNNILRTAGLYRGVEDFGVAGYDKLMK